MINNIKQPSVSKTAQFFEKNLFGSKPFKKLYKFAKENPDSFASRTALISAVTKDAFGCYYYVKQSYNNKRIPEEKRNFVSAMDLTNGILNVGIQLTVGLWIDKNSKNWFAKTKIGKELDEGNTVKLSEQLKPLVNKVKETENVTSEQIENFLRKGINGKSIMGNSGKAVTWLKVGFAAAVMLTATQVIIKRMIVPFLSTPLASFAKKKYFDKGANKPESTQAKPAGDKFTPTANAAVTNSVLDKTAFNKFTK